MTADLNSPRAAAYPLASLADGRHRLRRLAELLSLVREGAAERSLTYLDTFDWRLYEAGFALAAERDGERWRLLREDLDGGERCWAVCGSLPDFAWDLPAGRARARLRAIAEVRRLFPVVRVALTSERLRVRNSEDKAVADLYLERGLAGAPGDERIAARLAPSLRLRPVRGYDDDFARVRRLIEHETGLVADGRSRVQRALEAIGRRPLDYSSKLRVEVDPLEGAGEAVLRVLRALFDAMRANEDGVRRNLDPEFLHDFRVAVRRTRTCLGQLRSVLPPRSRDGFADEFSWLGDATGPARDLDVHMLRLEQYRALLPGEPHDDLVPLRDHLAGLRREQQRLLVEALDSARYRELVAGWERFLAERAGGGEDPWPAEAARAALSVASERIRRRFERVLERGARLDAGSRPEKLHRVRIDCKKLRYLLEFFRSLFPPGEIEPLVKELKRFQDNLGDFNDYSVQQETLSRGAAAMQQQGSAGAASLVLVGRLVEKLEALKQKERARFAKRFARFSSRGNRARVARMLAEAGGGR